MVPFLSCFPLLPLTFIHHLAEKTVWRGEGKEAGMLFPECHGGNWPCTLCLEDIEVDSLLKALIWTLLPPHCHWRLVWVFLTRMSPHWSPLVCFLFAHLMFSPCCSQDAFPASLLRPVHPHPHPRRPRSPATSPTTALLEKVKGNLILYFNLFCLGGEWDSHTPEALSNKKSFPEGRCNPR